MKEIEKVDILIVDDRHENLLALDGVLSAPDRNIVQAISGNDALARMLEYDFSLVLLDVQMPEMDGFETAQLMRGNKKTRGVPIVFVTAISKDQEFVFKGYESGAVDYLFKPLDPVILESKVKIFCELHRQRLLIENQVKEIEEKRQALEAQLEEINTLRGLLPICAWCKKVRNDDGLWEQVEVYIRDRAEVDFSHSICPDCLKEHF